MPRFLVTGTAGFIAARVSELLLRDGHTVLGVDNLNDAYDVRMKKYRLKRLGKHTEFSFVKLDVSNRKKTSALAEKVTDFDAVINLAARAGVRASLKNPWVYLDTNTTGTLNLLELCRNAKIPKFILASTSSVYGADAPLPTPESSDSSHPLQPYAASKKGAEALCHSHHFLYDLDVSVFRFFTVYGPAGRPDMSVFRFAKWIREEQAIQLNGDGTQTRGFTYVDDIARGVILGLKPVGFETINLGGHESISMLDLIRKLENTIGQKAIIEHRPFPKADMKANRADVSKAKRLLGWNPEISLDEGIKRTVAWYETQREWARSISTGKT